MSCDLTDPSIASASNQLQNDIDLTDWFLLGYRDTRDKLFVYSSGTKGLVELTTKLSAGEIHWAMVRMQGKTLLISWLPEGSITGVKRARALVHSRAVAGLLPHHATMTASHLSELNTAAVHHKLRLDGSSSVPPSPAIVQAAHPSPSPTQPHSLSPTYPAGAPYQSSNPAASPPTSPPPPPEESAAHRPSVTSLGSRTSNQTHSPPLSPPLTAPLSPSQTQPLSISALRAQKVQNGHPPRQAYGTYAIPGSQPTKAAVADPAFPPTSDHSHHTRPASPPQAQLSPPPPIAATLPGLGAVPSRHSMHPENEWREQQESRPSSAYGALAPEDDEPVPPLPQQDGNGVSSGLVEPASGNTVRSMASEQDLAAAAVEEALAGEAAKLELEQKEHELRTAEAEAAEREQAREVAEREARRKWEAEQVERERLDGEERARLEAEERERREAAERLRREEQRRAEAVAKAEEERVRQEEQARLAAEEDERREREAQAVREQEEAERAAVEQKAAARQAGKDQLVDRVRAAAASPDQVILSGHVTAQASDSIYWRRRFFQLHAGGLSLYKAEGEGKALAVVELPGRVRRVVDSPEEAWGVMNCFKLAMKEDGEDWLFFTDGTEDKELLVVGLKAVAGI